MSDRDDERPDEDADLFGAQPEDTPAHPDEARNQRRKLVIGGAAALAAVVGVGAVLLTNRTDDPMPIDAAAPVVTTASAGPGPTAYLDSVPGEAGPSSVPASAPAAPASTATKAAVSRAASAAPKTRDPEKVRKEIEAAREKAAEDGYPLQRPLTTPPQVRVQNAESFTEERRDLIDGGTMRIMSAKYDLSNQREMLWAAEKEKSAGGARCTQRFRFAQGAAPADRPSMLLCYRLSKDRSVVVLAVAKDGSPSQSQVLNALDTKWDRLG